MSTITDKLLRLNTYKKDIKQALIDKGQYVGNNMSEYAEAIESINGGEGGLNLKVNVDIDTRVTYLDNYPDLSDLQTNSNEVYLVLDNRNRDAWYVINIPDVTTIEKGHVEDNMFVVDGIVRTSLAANTTLIDSIDLDVDFPLVRIKGNTTLRHWNVFITATWNGLSYERGTAPIVEIIADVPNYVGNASSSTSRVTFYTEKITLKNVTTKCTSLQYLFYNGKNLYDIKIINCNFSNVTSISNAFMLCWNLEEIDLKRLFGDLPKVNNVYCAFYGCVAVKRIDLTAIKDMKVTSTAMSNLFYTCYALQEIVGYENWDTTASTSFSNVFSYCRSLKGVLDLSNWSITNKCTSLSAMFRDCYNLQSINLGDIDASNVKAIDYMFANCCSLNFDNGLKEEIENLQLTNKVTTIAQAFTRCYHLGGTFDLSGWTIENCPTNSLFNANHLIEKIILPPINMLTTNYMFSSCASLQEVVGLDKCSTNGCTNLANMFTDCFSLKELDLSFITDTSQCTSMASMFSACNSLQEIIFPEITYDTSKLTSFNSMISACYNLKRVVLPFRNQNGTASFQNTFSNCNRLQELITDLDLSHLTAASQRPVFSGCNNLRKLVFGIGPSIDLELKECYKLDRESVLDLVNKLPTVTSSSTLSLGQLRNLLTDSEKAIATSKGWTLA